MGEGSSEILFWLFNSLRAYEKEGDRSFSRAFSNKIRGNGFNLKEVVDAPFLKAFKARFNRILSKFT